MTYILSIDFVQPTSSKVLTHVIPAMERAQWLLGTLEAVFDHQTTLNALRVFAIIKLFHVVQPGTFSKCNNINRVNNECNRRIKNCRPISVYKELTFIKF